jgi:hypothetical protein
MDALDVFRVKPDGSLVWIGSASSMRAAHKMIKSAKVDPSDVISAWSIKPSGSWTAPATSPDGKCKDYKKTAIRKK